MHGYTFLLLTPSSFVKLLKKNDWWFVTVLKNTESAPGNQFLKSKTPPNFTSKRWIGPALWKLLCGPWNSKSPFAFQYYRPMLRNTRQSWILHPIPWIVDSGCWIPVFFSGTWILDSKALYSGYHEQNFPGFWILQARISQILESGYPYMGRSTSQTFFGPVIF